jgi:hypothetical protein
MNEQAEINSQNKDSSIMPPGESILELIDIDKTSLKLIKNSWQRTQYRAIVNMNHEKVLQI